MVSNQGLVVVNANINKEMHNYVPMYRYLCNQCSKTLSIGIYVI